MPVLIPDVGRLEWAMWQRSNAGYGLMLVPLCPVAVINRDHRTHPIRCDYLFYFFPFASLESIPHLEESVEFEIGQCLGAKRGEQSVEVAELQGISPVLLAVFARLSFRLLDQVSCYFDQSCAIGVGNPPIRLRVCQSVYYPQPSDMLDRVASELAAAAVDVATGPVITEEGSSSQSIADCCVTKED